MLAIGPSADLSVKNHSRVRVHPWAPSRRGTVPGLRPPCCGHGWGQGVDGAPRASQIWVGRGDPLREKVHHSLHGGPEGCDQLWASPGSGARLSPVTGDRWVQCTRTWYESRAVMEALCEHTRHAGAKS